MEKNILSFSSFVQEGGVGEEGGGRHSDLIKIGEPWRATAAASTQVPF